MKTKTIGLTLIMATLALASCGSNNSSTDTSSDNTSSEIIEPSSSEEVVPEGISISEILKKLAYSVGAEAVESNKALVTQTTTINDLKTEIVEEFDLYNDGTSQGKATYKKTDKGQIIDQTTFTKRRATTTDKILVDGKAISYPMFVKVTDYEQDINYEHSDKASKVYLVESEYEAENAGLEPGSYVTKLDLPIESSRKVTQELREFIYGYTLGSRFAPQLEHLTFDKNEEADYNNYTIDFSYDYPGELNDTITEKVEVSFDINKEETNLLKTEYAFIHIDTNNDDPEDVRTTEVKTVASLNYGKKGACPTDALKVNDYFLTEVKDVQIYQNGKFGGFEPVDADIVSRSSSYIQAKAKVYSPSKSVELGIAAKSSTNPNVITVNEDGTMEVKDIGTTIITFIYNGQLDGVFQLREIKKEITVVVPELDEIRMFAFKILDNVLLKGVPNKIEVRAYPQEAVQDFTVKADNPDAVALEKVEGGFNVTGLIPGDVTLTVTSRLDETKTHSMTFHIIDDLNYVNVLNGNTYKTIQEGPWKKPEFTLNFNLDGTGKRIQHTMSGDYTDTFNYKVVGTQIKFSNWSSGTPVETMFKSATIMNSEASRLEVIIEWPDEEEGGTHLTTMVLGAVK